jgi:hypothetical protein
MVIYHIIISVINKIMVKCFKFLVKFIFSRGLMNFCAMAQWTEYSSIAQKLAGSISAQDKYLHELSCIESGCVVYMCCKKSTYIHTTYALT